MSCRATWRTPFDISRLSISPIPTGLTPGHLSRVMRQQALGQIFPLGQGSWNTTSWLAWQWHFTGPPRFRGRKSTFSSNHLHWDQKVQQSHPFAGRWIGSLGHLSDQKYFCSRKALTNRWGYCWLPWWVFVLEMFVVLPSGWRLSKGRLTLPWCSVINLIATLTLPIATSFQMILLFFLHRGVGSRILSVDYWIVQPSWTRVSRSPFFHFLSLLSRQLMPSLFWTWYRASGVAGWASPSLLSWLCSPMLWHHCMLLSVGITQRQSQYLPSPWELQTDFFSSLLILHMPCPPAMIESPHQYLPIQKLKNST